MNHKTLVINFTFLLALVLSLVGVNQFLKGKTVQQTDPDETPDAYLINASFLQTNELGEQEIVLSSPAVKHYQKDDRSFFEKPFIKLFKQGQHWIISSAQARGKNGAKIFYLDKNVEVRELPSAKNAGTKFYTNSLTVFPQKELVVTKDSVTINQPGLKVTGKGLIGSLKDGTIQLLANSKGQYDPPKK